jgi:hypothetical protein
MREKLIFFLLSSQEQNLKNLEIPEHCTRFAQVAFKKKQARSAFSFVFVLRHIAQTSVDTNAPFILFDSQSSIRGDTFSITSSTLVVFKLFLDFPVSLFSPRLRFRLVFLTLNSGTISSCGEHTE